VEFKKEKIKVIKKINSLDNVIRGSVFEYKRYCGKSSCNCARMKKPYKELKAAIDELARINGELLRSEQ
jgi:hypothetical protein